VARIAISYRREDTGWITGRIFDRLKNHYEGTANTASKPKAVVFLDYDSTPVGVDFREYIKQAFDNCDVLVAVIGPHWVGDDGTGKTRLDRADDWVRIEVETALRKNIPVIPVLIDRTPMPSKESLPGDVRDLVYRQAAVIDTQLDFDPHMERLIRQIDQLTGEPSKSRSPMPLMWKAALIAGLLILSVGALSYRVWVAPMTSAKMYSKVGNFACFDKADYPDTWRQEAVLCTSYGCNFGKMSVEDCLILGARKQSTMIIHGNMGTTRADECWLQHSCGDLRPHNEFTMFSSQSQPPSTQ
jgi:hypothetical protein